MNKKKQESLFRQMIQYFNRRKYITRIFLMMYFQHYNVITIDTYRNYFRAAGFLETVSLGKYRRIKKIPKDITELELKKMCYTYESLNRNYNRR